MNDGCAEGLHAGERRVGIGSSGEIGEMRSTFGDAGEHGVAVRDGFVARKSDGALQRSCRTDALCGRCGRHCFQLKCFWDVAVYGRSCRWLFGEGIRLKEERGGESLRRVQLWNRRSDVASSGGRCRLDRLG